MSMYGDKRKIGLLLSGQPIFISEINIYITQPKIKDIVLFGEDDFFTTVQLLVDMQKFTSMIKKGNSQLNIISDFQLLLIMIEEDFTVKKMIQNLFALIFPNYEIKITENSLDFIFEETNQIVGKIHPFNFEFLQNILSDLFIPQRDNEDEPEYNPANEAAAKIAEKIKKGREKVQSQKSTVEGPYSIFADYCSTLSIGMHMDINIFFNYTSFQLYDAYRRFFSKEQSDFYMRISSMPMMDTSKMEPPPPWQRNLY